MTAKRAYMKYLNDLEKTCTIFDYIKIAIMCSYYEEDWFDNCYATTWWASLSNHDRLALKRVPAKFREYSDKIDAGSDSSTNYIITGGFIK